MYGNRSSILYDRKQCVVKVGGAQASSVWKMKEVRITVDLGSGRGRYEVNLQLDDSITSGETVQLLLDSLELQQQSSQRKGRWQLIERWRGCGE